MHWRSRNALADRLRRRALAEALLRRVYRQIVQTQECGRQPDLPRDVTMRVTPVDIRNVALPPAAEARDHTKNLCRDHRRAHAVRTRSGTGGAALPDARQPSTGWRQTMATLWTPADTAIRSAATITEYERTDGFLYAMTRRPNLPTSCSCSTSRGQRRDDPRPSSPTRPVTGILKLQVWWALVPTTPNASLWCTSAFLMTERGYNARFVTRWLARTITRVWPATSCSGSCGL